MITLKSCKVCKSKFPENEFPSAGILNGKQYYRAKCPACYQAVKRKRRHNLARWIEDYKKTQKCNRCPEDDFRVLVFHHVNDDKEFNVADGARGFSLEKILREINKCEVLCYNCHAKHHYDERSSGVSSAW